MFQEKIIDNRKRFKYWKKLWNILGKDKKLGVKRCMLFNFRDKKYVTVFLRKLNV